MAKTKQAERQTNAPVNKKRGAPAKQQGEKIGHNHLRQDQTARINGLVIERNVPFVVILREAVDFYLQALENNEKRGGATQ